MIQVASEHLIVLFHIGLHTGKTSEEILAPSLKKLIEDPNIAKVGVGINSADFTRLRKHFGLQPRGAMELSHLYRLTKFHFQPELLTTRLNGLANQVQEHLGLPLYKGDVRTSNWSRPLDQKQIEYAASDVYAGLMLYHCMNAKRLSLVPVPPLPIFAELYKDPSWNSNARLQLRPFQKDGPRIMADKFFASGGNMKAPGEQADKVESNVTRAADKVESNVKSAADKVESDVKKAADKAESNVKSAADKVESSKEITAEKRKKSAKTTMKLDPTAQALYKKLSDCRLALATKQGVPAFHIASNTVLEALTCRLPRNTDELLEVKGIGKVKVAKYGAAWLEVIAEHGNLDEVLMPAGVSSEGTMDSQPIKPTSHPRRQRAVPTQDPSDSSQAFGSPIPRTATLHTGLSFSLAESYLDEPLTSGPKIKGEDGAQLQHDEIETPDLTGIGGNLDNLTNGKAALRSQPDRSHDLGKASIANPPLQSRASSDLKRKWSVMKSESQDTDPEHGLTDPLPLPLKLFKNKLLAFRALVTREWKDSRSPDAGPIVSDATLDQIVAISPRTAKELHGIAGIEEFVRACEAVKRDLLKNIIHFAPH